MGILPSRLKSWKAWLLILIIAGELGRIHFMFNAFSHRGSDYPRRALVDEMRIRLGPPDHARFFAPGGIRAFPPNTGSIFGLSDIRGYSNLPVDRYRLLLECAEGKNMANNAKIENLVSPIYRLLAGKYLLVYFPSEIKTPLFERDPSSTHFLFRRLASSPRAYMVHHIMEVEDEAQMRRVLSQSRFDPSLIVALEKAAGPLPPFEQPQGPETVTIVSHESDRVKIRVEASAPGMLVLADVFYPGWQATVDGAPARIYPANWGVRGLAIGPGTHEVLFTYRPWWLWPGAMVMILSLIGIGSRLLAGVRRTPGEHPDPGVEHPGRG